MEEINKKINLLIAGLAKMYDIVKDIIEISEIQDKEIDDLQNKVSKLKKKYE